MQVQDLPLFAQGSQGESSKKSKPSAPAPLTVSQLTQKIKSQLEKGFALVQVQGEVSNCKAAPSGHVYFTLKDEGASLSAVCFRSTWAKYRNLKIDNGHQITCTGKISLYAPRGQYQLIVESIEPVGSGALYLAFEKLKQKLQTEGLFDANEKLELPELPQRIGIVTSLTGAALQDFLNVLKRRAPWLEVLISGSMVQGAEAPSQLIRALKRLQNLKLPPEVIVMARGGGSIEDLWAFNDEQLAREIFESEIPIISAVGHEVDFTICDFVADYRAPTPSAGAEIVSNAWPEAAQRPEQWVLQAKDILRQKITEKNLELRSLRARLISPKDQVRQHQQRVDDLQAQLARNLEQRLAFEKQRLRGLRSRLHALSPLQVLERGYAIVEGYDDKTPVVKRASQTHSGQDLQIRFADGRVGVRVR